MQLLPLWADSNNLLSEFLTTIITLVGGGGIGWFLKWLKGFLQSRADTALKLKDGEAKIQKQERDDKNRDQAAAIVQLNRVLEWQGRQMENQGKQIDQQQRAITILTRRYDECRRSESYFEACLMIVLDYARRQAQILKDHGIAAEPVPELPKREEFGGSDADEREHQEMCAMEKQTAQDTVVLKKEGEMIKEEVTRSKTSGEGGALS